jgi:outer membrane scaffolding protein for murein synthesis (MipA/OmpV family)
MHVVSVPSALIKAAACALLASHLIAALAQGEEPRVGGSSSTAALDPGSRWPHIAAFGLSLNHRPTYAGSPDSKWSATPNVVVQWGRLTLSNGGTLASRAGEPAESGVTAEVLSRDRIKVRAALRLDEGRNSSDIPRLMGLHDTPGHLQGRLQVGWRLHDQWELLGAWRMDLSGRGAGDSAEVVVLHDWRPEFLNHHRWRVSAGAAAQWRSARQANLVHGVDLVDASRTAFAVYRLHAGFTDARLFANWRYSLDGPWVAYGSVSAETLVGQAADSPITVKPRAGAFSVGLGRRF